MLRWFKKPEPKACVVVAFGFEGDPPAPPGAPPGVRDDEPLDALHDEFLRTFRPRPDEVFAETVRDAPRFRAWLGGGEAEAAAFVRLAVDAARKGVPFGEQTAVVGFRHGGAPPKATQDALSVLAQTIGTRIKLYFESEGGETRVLDFAP